MLICFAALVVTIISGLQWHARSKLHKGLVQEIRERPKVKVKLASEDAESHSQRS